MRASSDLAASAKAVLSARSGCGSAIASSRLTHLVRVRARLRLRGSYP